MTDFIYPETGEFTGEEDAEQVDLTTIALRRHEAKLQEEAWNGGALVFDAILLKRQEQGRAVYADRIAIRVAGATCETFNRRDFAAALDNEEFTQSQLLELATAAKSFVKDELVDPLRRSKVAECTARLQKKPWIESQPVLRVAPDSNPAETAGSGT